MKLIFVLLLFTGSSFINQDKRMPSQRVLHYLALGDSYTIGEMVPAAENFPAQVVQLLEQKGVRAEARIIARTGWTTDELKAGIEAADQEYPLLEKYDRVSLLIGVNNQYRGRSADQYREEFTSLLEQALGYAGGNPDHVVVVSIPDWGVTPYAGGRDRVQIAREIDTYNKVNREVADAHRIHYIDITPWTREAAGEPDLLAADGLHPSGKEYRRWAEKLAEYFMKD